MEAALYISAYQRRFSQSSNTSFGDIYGWLIVRVSIGASVDLDSTAADPRNRFILLIPVKFNQNKLPDCKIAA